MTETRPQPAVPESVSPEAQAWLANTTHFADVPEPTGPDDVDGWLNFIAVRDAQIADVLYARLPADLPIERTDTDINGVRTYVLRPHHVPDDPASGIYLEIHGGGLVMCGGELCARMSTGGAL